MFINILNISYNKVKNMALKEKILQQLEKHNALSSLELELLNNIPYSSVRARISELRKKGYIITYEEVPTKKYILSKQNKLISYLYENNLIGKNISIEKVSRDLSVDREELVEMISKLFESYDVIQVSSKNVIIGEKNE